MRFIVTSVPLTGHVNPMISIARFLIDAGHAVVGCGPSALAPRFACIGAGFHAFPAEIDRDLSVLGDVFPEYKAMFPGPEMLRFYFQRLFIDPFPFQHAALIECLRKFPADVIVCDGMFFGALPMLLEPRRVRPAIVHCGITLLSTSRADGAPFGPGFPPAQNDDVRRRYAQIKDALDQHVFVPVTAGLNEKLGELGCEPLHGPLLDALATLPDLYLQPSIPELELPDHLALPGLRYVGVLPPPDMGAALPDWAGDLAGCRVVLVTQGTMANGDMSQLVAPSMEALADREGFLVVATTGGLGEGLPPEIPANARVARFLPFDWLWPHVDLVVTNGGFGTVSQALSRGIPVIVAGVTEDKAEVASHVARTGAGLDLKTGSPSVGMLRAAVDRVLTDESYRLAADRLRQAFARYDTPRLVVDLLTRLAADRVRERGGADGPGGARLIPGTDAPGRPGPRFARKTCSNPSNPQRILDGWKTR